MYLLKILIFSNTSLKRVYSSVNILHFPQLDPWLLLSSFSSFKDHIAATFIQSVSTFLYIQYTSQIGMFLFPSLLIKDLYVISSLVPSTFSTKQKQSKHTHTHRGDGGRGERESNQIFLLLFLMAHFVLIVIPFLSFYLQQQKAFNVLTTQLSPFPLEPIRISFSFHCYTQSNSCQASIVLQVALPSG